MGELWELGWRPRGIWQGTSLDTYRWVETLLCVLIICRKTIALHHYVRRSVHPIAGHGAGVIGAVYGVVGVAWGPPQRWRGDGLLYLKQRGRTDR